MVIHRDGKIDWFETLFEILPVALTIVFIASAVIFVIVSIFVGVSQCQASIIDASINKDIISKESLALFRAQEKQVMIWVVENTNNHKNEGAYTTIGLGIIVGNRKVITSKKIFDKFLNRHFIFFAARSDFYWGSAENIINRNIVSWVEEIELYESIAVITVVDESRTFSRMQKEFLLPINKHYESGDKIFILGDRDNAKKPENIKGKIINSSHENFIVELFSDDNNIIEKQIALGATVWDSNGNFIGFLTERIGSTNKAQLTILDFK